MDVFQRAALPFVWRPENDGQPFHDDPRDAGGATSWGVTYRTWAAYCALHGDAADFETFRVADRSAFVPLYRAQFWQAVRGDELPPGVAVSAFDAAVMSGSRRAVMFLQGAVGAVADGLFGPRTAAAVVRSDPATVVRAIRRERAVFYSTLPAFATFGRGWTRRAADCEALSLSLTQPGAPAP